MAAEQTRVVAAACDGACSGNPGPGGWGCLLRFEDGSVRELGGAAAATTNNRMELTAALALMTRITVSYRYNLHLGPGFRPESRGTAPFDFAVIRVSTYHDYAQRPALYCGLLLSVHFNCQHQKSQ